MESMSVFDKVKDEHHFYLMNKDTKIATFKVIGSGIFEQVKIEQVLSAIPFWIRDLASFITNRRPPKKRENIEDLLKRSGCDTLLGYLQITHALSLIDTFWVKSIDSDLTWDKMSLFTHDFNEVIAKTAFEGGLHGYNLETTSPEYGTDRTLAKCWIKENGIIKLMKRGSSGARNAGREPYSEFYISQIAKELKLNYVDYTLRSHNKRICSVCNAFTSEKKGYVPFAAVGPSAPSIAPVLDVYKQYGLEDKARDMFVFDAIVFNEDRHKGNFGFLVDNDTFEILDMAPLFDHNIALLCYAEEDNFEDIDNYLAQKGPCLGNDFVSDARQLLTPTMRKRLTQLKGFEFKKDTKYNLPDWKLEKLNFLVNRQIDQILA